MNVILYNISKHVDKLFINSEIINGNTLIFKQIDHFNDSNIDALLIRNDIIVLVYKLTNYCNFNEYMTLETLKIILDIKCTEYYKSRCIFNANNYGDIESLNNFKESFYTYINGLVDEYSNKYNEMCIM